MNKIIMDISLFKLTKEELKSLLPYKDHAEKAFKLQCCSLPLYQSDFVYIADTLIKKGWNISKVYSCNSCIINCLATLYRVLSHECNAKAIDELTNPQPKPEPKPQQKSKNVSKKQNAKVSKK